MSNNNHKIIICTPDVTSPAGVANHYLGLRDFFSSTVIYNQYKSRNYVKRVFPNWPEWTINILRALIMIWDVVKFIWLLILYKRPTVLLNPSFGKTAMRRDGMYLRIAKLFGCKVAVFIHGWDNRYAEDIRSGRYAFSKVWQDADCFFVLAKEFEEGLRELGIKAPILLTTTKVNDHLLRDFKRSAGEGNNILFLARVIKEKGIYVAIDAFEKVKNVHENASLNVVGSGEELERAISYAKARGLCEINFSGPLSGESLRNAFINADVYILPTAHGEGMPTSVLEIWRMSDNGSSVLCTGITMSINTA